MNYQETLDYLDVVGETRMRLNLETSNKLIALLDHPEKESKNIIIAGTNGKGSTSVFLTSIMTSIGIRTGTFLSPHVETVRERMLIDGEAIDEKSFAELASELMETLNANDMSDVTYFEFLTALSLLAFKRYETKVNIFEVGLGGRLDSTNVLSRSGTIITSIDYDHQSVLGNTLSEIAKEKGAIMRAGQPVIIAEQKEKARKALLEQAVELGARTLIVQKDFQHSRSWKKFTFSGMGLETPPVSLGIPGNHQCENAAAAIAMISQMEGIRNDMTTEHIVKGLTRASLPGRLEKWVNIETKKEIWLDIAHNAEAAQSISDFFTQEQLAPLSVLIGMLKEKDHVSFVQRIMKIADTLIITNPPSPRSWDGKKVGKIFVENPLEALVSLIEKKDKILCTGSVYLVGTLRSSLPSLGFQRGISF